MEENERPDLNIYIVRHGETEGNINRRCYIAKADHAIRLTPEGEEQARKTGFFLANSLATKREFQGAERFGQVRVWYSSYYRARETANWVLESFKETSSTLVKATSYREEPFLIEQRAGLFDGLDDIEFREAFPAEAKDYEKNKKYNGACYARSPLGDSRLDVVRNVKEFFGTIHRDYARGIRHAVVVCHGVTARAFIMAWMRYPMEWLEAEMNPGNCSVRYISGNSVRGYTDHGYIFGSHVPAGDLLATQKELPHPEDIVLLKPQRKNGLVPKGVIPLDPFKCEPS